MPKELEKLSEKEIQQRLYGGYLKPEPKRAEKPPAVERKENPSQKAVNNGSGLKIVWGFAFGIAAVLLIGFLIVRQEKPPRKPSVPVPKTTPAAASRPYTIQVMVYENKEGARKAVDDLKRRGFPAFIKENKTVSGKLQLRIYVGEFMTQEEAKSTLTMLKNNPSYYESFIRKK